MTAPLFPDEETAAQLRAAGWAPAKETGFAAGVTATIHALAFLAEARADYTNGPADEYADTENERMLRMQVATTRQLANMLAGTHETWGWLPSWTGHLWEPYGKVLATDKAAKWERTVKRQGMAEGIRDAVATVCGPEQPLGEHQTYCVVLLKLADDIEKSRWEKADKVAPAVNLPTVEQEVAERIATDLDGLDAEAANHVRLAYELPGALHMDGE